MPDRRGINPTIGVVQELVSRGVQVVYFCIEAFREPLERAGASVRTLDSQKFVQAFLSGGRDFLLQRINGLLLTADVVIPSVLEQTEGECFDCIIHDSMFGCGRMLAHILKLPAISSCTSFAQTPESVHALLEQFYLEVPEETAAPIRRQFHSLTAGLKEKYKLEIPSPYEVFCNPAPVTIVYTTRDFQPHGEAFDSSHRFVGPVLTGRQAQEHVDLTAFQGKLRVYISMGTVFNRVEDFYKLCMEAFGNTDYIVLMAVGDQVQTSSLGDIPVNFVVKNHVPQVEVLQQAELFITHGGMNSVHEGLFFGVPLIVIPQGADQPVIAEQVARLGAGLVLDRQALTAARLRDAAGQVTGAGLPAYRAAAEKIRESFRKSGGYRQAVDEIMKVIHSHKRGQS